MGGGRGRWEGKMVVKKDGKGGKDWKQVGKEGRKYGRKDGDMKGGDGNKKRKGRRSERRK